MKKYVIYNDKTNEVLEYSDENLFNALENVILFAEAPWIHGELVEEEEEKISCKTCPYFYADEDDEAFCHADDWNAPCNEEESYEEDSYDEVGFDPYEGCYTYDC